MQRFRRIPVAAVLCLSLTAWLVPADAWANHAMEMRQPYVAGGILVPATMPEGPWAVVPGVPCATESDAIACFSVSDLHGLTYTCWTEDAVFGVQFDQPLFASQAVLSGVHTSGAILAYGRGFISGTVGNNLNTLVVGVPTAYLDGQPRYDGSAGDVVCEFA